MTSSSNCNGDVKTFRLEDIIECVGHVTSIGDTDMAWQLHRPPTSINDDTEITGPDNDGLEVEQSKQATEAYHGQYEAEIEGHCGGCRRPFTFLSFSLLFIFSFLPQFSPPFPFLLRRGQPSEIQLGGLRSATTASSPVGSGAKPQSTLIQSSL